MIIYRYTLIILLCQLHRMAAFSQCPPSGAAWMEKILTIENSEEGLQERIALFEGLQSLHDRCGAARDSIQARILHRLGDLYRQAGDVAKGIRYAQSAAAINSSGLPDAQRSFLTHSYYNLGLYHSQLYLFAQSNLYFDSCIAIGTSYPEKNYIALMAYEQKAFAFHQVGDYQHSVETANQGILLAGQLQDPLAAAFIGLQKVQSQLALEQLDAAEKNILQVIEVLGKDPASADYLATSYSVYALLLNTRKEPQRAAGYYRKALVLNKELRNPAQCARDLIDLGYLYDLDLHDARRAMACYTEGMQFARQANDAYLKAGLLNNMGVVQWRQKKYREALRYYQQGLMVLPLSFHPLSDTSNPDAGHLPLAGNDYFVYSLLSNKAEALLELARATGEEAWMNAAHRSFYLADKLVDQMRWKQQSERSKLFWRRQTKKMYEKAIEAAYYAQRPEQAFYYFEKSRAVLLNDRLNELGARKFLSPAELDREQALRIRLASLQQQLAGLAPADRQYNAIWQQLYNTRELLYRFISNLEKTHPSYYQYKYDTTALGIDTLRKTLQKQGQTLVEYFNGDSALYILTVSASATQLHRLSFPGYAGMARELLELVASRSSLNRQYDRYRSIAHILYDSLFRSIGVSGKRVIISPDDYFIPFELLLTDVGDANSFLLKQHAFSYTYSARFLGNGDGAPLASNLLGIAPVHYQAHLRQSSLAGADQSLQSIGKYFGSATLLTQDRASKKQFLAQLARFPVVQLYSHADADSSGTEPVLYLADSALYLNELQALGALQTRLMVLAACNTGVGKNMRGEGVFSLARGFAAAGIPATITNLWPVDNQTTYALTELFYRRLHDGLPADEALQQAKLDFLEQNDAEKELPYFWAAGLLIGRAEVMEPQKQSSSLMAWIIGGIVVLAAVVFFVMGNSVKQIKRK